MNNIELLMKGPGNMIIKYRERIYIDKYRCIDIVKKINAIKMFQSGGLLYVYKDKYNIMTIEKENVIEIEKKGTKKHEIKTY